MKNNKNMSIFFNKGGKICVERTPIEFRMSLWLRMRLLKPSTFRILVQNSLHKELNYLLYWKEALF